MEGMLGMYPMVGMYTGSHAGYVHLRVYREAYIGRYIPTMGG